MSLALLQLPMTLFTTLVPMASGAFIGLAIAFLTTRFSDGCLKRIDRWTLLPLGIIAVGFVAAFLSLAFPQGATSVLRDIGGAGFATGMIVPLTGLAFSSLAVVYWIIALTGNLGYRARTVFAVVVGVGALALSLSIGMSLAGSSALSWSALPTVVGLMGFCVAGGVPLGVLVVALGGGLQEAENARFASALVVAAFIGVVASIFGVASQMLFAQSLVAALVPGAEALPGSWVYLVISIIGFVVMLACLRTALSPDRTSALGRTAGATAGVPIRDRGDVLPVGERSAVPLLVGGNAAVLAAIFVACLVFYALPV
ncbi:DMSO reductase [Gordonibacter sp. An230]|uniref:DMSO reductase n=1 Tax=Gordonibacter sp. An230 TaxID=1965592 RepID=UPI000B3A465C|nr:DMSO reductase [Gordonibacter sp. An230]OUO87594.1 DMSO reductase [Gordonibacter sp. An230]